MGRRRELDAIKRLLESNRLVTLMGVGGAGKTRLARRATADLVRVFKEAAWIVELADVQDPELLGHTVAAAVGLQVKSADFEISLLTDFFGDRRVLLTLDNCEHLADACSELVDDILAACPGVRVLATSQQALGLASESIFQVPPLSLPEPGSECRPDGLTQYESIALFVDRAAALQPGFELNAGNAASVVELCRALEGIPLALELAAARIRVLTPQAMLDRLNDRYQLLNRGFGGRVPDRQRSLEASVHWTYDLCTEPEQQLWSALSVFRGGFGLDAAETVAGVGALEDGFLDLLAALVDKSVLLREDDGVRVRYHMLETLRLYGDRQLTKTGELDAVRRRHRDFFLDLALRYEAEWTGPRQVDWLRQLNEDHANFRMALQFSVENDEPGPALRILSSLEGFWITAGLVSEARRWMDLALAESPNDVEGLPVALRVAAWFALVQVDIEAAGAIVDGLRLLAGPDEAATDPATLAQARLGEGLLAAWEGEADRGISLVEQATEGFQQLGDLSTMAFGLVVSGMLRGFSGDTDGAAALQHTCVELTEPRGELYMRSFALAMLGIVALAEGRTDEATSLLREALGMKRQLGDQLGIALTLEFLAWIAMAEARGERAATLLGAAGSIWNGLGVSLRTLPHFSERRAESEAAARAMLSKQRFEDAAALGAALDTATAISFALEEKSPGPSRKAAGGKEKSPLTAREREVASLVSEGLTNQQIADRLVVSTRTAEAHVENILRKLGFSSRLAIAAWAAEHEKELGR